MKLAIRIVHLYVRTKLDMVVPTSNNSVRDSRRRQLGDGYTCTMLRHKRHSQCPRVAEEAS